MTATPTAGLAYPVGGHAALVTVRPDARGAVKVRATTACGPAFGRRLDLRLDDAHGLARPGSLASVSGDTTKTLTVVGRSGIPSTAQDVAAVVNAPRGATVRIWRSPPAPGRRCSRPSPTAGPCPSL